MTIDDRASRVVVVPLIASSLVGASARFVQTRDDDDDVSVRRCLKIDWMIDDPKTRSESVATNACEEPIHLPETD